MRLIVGAFGQDARVTTLHPLPFFSNETRQVWALHKDTGEPYYLDEGEAERAKAAIQNLRCLSYECDVRIIAIGGKKRRHHFRHHRGGCPATGGESAMHLAGKAMIAAWLDDHAPVGSVVKVEQHIHPRRPDVVVTQTDGARTAYEVEYKSWAIEDWEAKQADLDASGVAVAWLVGHIRFAPLVSEDAGATDGSTRIAVPALAQAIAESGRPLLAINPLTREIGTLMTGGDRLYRGASGGVRLTTDSIDECRFDPFLGMVTPTLDRLLRREREIAEREEAERLARERPREELDPEPETVPVRVVESEPTPGPVSTLVATPLTVTINRPQPIPTWTALREVLTERWGDVDLPAIFGEEEITTPGIRVPVAHWHAVVHEVLLHERGYDFAFTVDDALRALREYRIADLDLAAARAAIEAWLRELTPVGLVREYTYDRPGDRFRFFTATDATVHGPQASPRSYPQYVDTLRRRLQALGDRTDDARRRMDCLGLGNLTRPVAFGDGAIRWVPRAPWADGQANSPWANRP